MRALQGISPIETPKASTSRRNSILDISELSNRDMQLQSTLQPEQRTVLVDHTDEQKRLNLYRRMPLTFVNEASETSRMDQSKDDIVNTKPPRINIDVNYNRLFTGIQRSQSQMGAD